MKGCDELSFQLIENFAKEFTGKASKKVMSQSTKAEGAIARNPCILTKLASYLDVSSVRLIVSKQFTGLADSFKSCGGLLGGTISKSVAFIDKNELDFVHLQMHALRYLSRDIRCFVIICGDICSDLLLHIADKIGFGADVYFWVTISAPALRYEIKYPKNIISLTFTGENLNGTDVDLQERLLVIAYGKSTSISIRKARVIMEVMNDIKSGRYSINYHGSFPEINPPAMAQIRILKVAIIARFGTELKPQFLDPNKGRCLHGLLCWTVVLQNISYSEKWEPSCCVGFFMDILLQ